MLSARVSLLSLAALMPFTTVLGQDQVQPPRRNAKKGDFARFPLGLRSR